MSFAHIFAIVLFSLSALSIFAVIAAEQWKSYREGADAFLEAERQRSMAAHPAGKGRI